MHAPRSVEEFLRILDDVIFDVEEAIASAEYEGDTIMDITELVPTYQQFHQQLKALFDDVKQGTHAFGSDDDLPYMEQALRFKLRIPFAQALFALNEAHRKGFDDAG